MLTIDGQLAFNGGFTNYGTVRGSGTFTGDFTNAGLVTLDGGTLAGNINPIDNTGTIQGAGSLNARVVNTGVIRASGGQLSLGSPNNSNEVGGLVQAADGNTVMFLQGLVTNAGSISLTGGALDNNNHPLSNTGIVNGSGIVRTGGLTSTGAINIGGGDLDVFGNVTNNGTVAIQGARMAYFYGDVDGAGNYTGAGTAVYLAGFSPGNSPAAVSFAGNAVLATTSTLNIELGGTDPGAEYDQLLVSGALSLGGFLNVSLTGGFTPAANQSFDILDWGTLSGAFNTIQLPDLSGGLEWNTSQLYTTGVLSVASPGLLGDYNQNGIVDAADYVVWRKNEGTNNVLPNDSIGGTIGHAQYDEWRAQFGQTTSSGSIASAPVPEPSSIRVLAIVCCGLFARRRFVPRNPRRPLRAA